MHHFDLCLTCGAVFCQPRLRSGIAPPDNADPDNPGITVVVTSTFNELVLTSVESNPDYNVLLVAWAEVALEPGSPAAVLMQAVRFLARVLSPETDQEGCDRCSVCQLGIAAPFRLPCGHTFHRQCLELVHPPKCPNCRAPFALASVESPSEEAPAPAARGGTESSCPNLRIATVDVELNELDPKYVTAVELKVLPCVKLFSGKFPDRPPIAFKPVTGQKSSPLLAQLTQFLAANTTVDIGALLVKQLPSYCSAHKIVRLALCAAQGLSATQWQSAEEVHRFYRCSLRTLTTGMAGPSPWRPLEEMMSSLCPCSLPWGGSRAPLRW